MAVCPINWLGESHEHTLSTQIAKSDGSHIVDSQFGFMLSNGDGCGLNVVNALRRQSTLCQQLGRPFLHGGEASIPGRGRLMSSFIGGAWRSNGSRSAQVNRQACADGTSISVDFD